MGAVEHLKTLCCLGLKPESAMIAVTPLLHEIIPHGWSRMAFIEPDATLSRGYAENPAMASQMERFLELLHNPANIIGSIYPSTFRAIGVGFALQRQGRGWLESDWYREIEAPVDSCWWIEVMIGDRVRTFATVHLTRPRSARPFTADDVQKLDRLRPWLAHAFRWSLPHGVTREDDFATVAGRPVLSGQMVLASDATVILQTKEIPLLLAYIDARRIEERFRPSGGDCLPAPVLSLVQQLIGAANGSSRAPPHTQIASRFGVLTLDAKWLVPEGVLPGDAAKDPKSCLIAATIELREHALARAARVLREGGATPAQMKVGIQLALGKSKPAIAKKLGLASSSVASLAKKLYQTLDIHNSTELAAKIWLSEETGEVARSAQPAKSPAAAPARLGFPGAPSRRANKAATRGAAAR
jgi:DNA-binding CsgD family transcriptional regulator